MVLAFSLFDLTLKGKWVKYVSNSNVNFINVEILYLFDFNFY